MKDMSDLEVQAKFPVLTEKLGPDGLRELVELATLAGQTDLGGVMRALKRRRSEPVEPGR